MVKEFKLINEYISITFSDTFINELSKPPYIKIPFALLNDITTNNYKFIMFFINKLFSVNPSSPFFLNIKIKELLKITSISLSTSQAFAAERLNNYLAILEKYHVINEQILYNAEDIRKNKLLRFRLSHFKYNNPIPIEDNEIEEL